MLYWVFLLQSNLSGKFAYIFSCLVAFLNEMVFINIKYNCRPTVKKKGSAIFLHLTNNNYKPTSGCVAIKKKDFLKILPLINKKTKISIT